MGHSQAGACLAFINRTSGTWQCEDSSLEIGFDSDGQQTVTGNTTHFTTFAVLVSGDDDGEDGDSGGWQIVYLAPILVGGALLIVVLVVVTVTATTVIVKLKYRRKQRRLEEHHRGAVNFGEMTPRGRGGGRQIQNPVEEEIEGVAFELQGS
jgi:hypothetical protein